MMTAHPPLSQENWHELKRVVVEKRHWQNRLEDATCLVANRAEVDVCSVYLREEPGSQLVLRATVGLRQSSVGKLAMQFDEGLVGLVAQTQRPLAVENAPAHPRFKYFAEADEDAYHSFLGVPVLLGGQVRGVLVVQTIEPRRFSIEEANVLREVAKNFAAILRDAC
ncbi:MAG: GAF domain-containing protein [Planctomycetales bacterium]|nr:GAF domain-containing protein [Planctomycetales bacterium]